MANCLITAGHVIDCYDVTPGVRNIYIANYDKDMTFAYDADNVITGLTPSISATTFYQYEVPMQVAGLDDVSTTDQALSTTIFTPAVTFPVNGLNKITRNQLLLLARARVSIIIEDENGNYLFCGKKRGMASDTSKQTTGIASGSRSGYEFSFKGYEPEPANFIAYSAFSSLIG